MQVNEADSHEIMNYLVCTLLQIKEAKFYHSDDIWVKQTIQESVFDSLSANR